MKKQILATPEVRAIICIAFGRNTFDSLTELGVNVSSNFACHRSRQLIDLRELTPECRELIFSRYGIPYREMSEVAKIFPEMEILSELSRFEETLQIRKKEKCTFGKDYRRSYGTPSRRMKSSGRSGNTPCQSHSLDKVNSFRKEFCRVAWCRPL